ncbi:MAG: Ig-like domain-containing protein [Cyanophyceae cyanobacterium]|mgnify:CR=1 FL=1
MDTIFGGTGPESFLGSNGDDVLTGDRDRDTLLGLAGNDSIQGNAGADLVFGNRGVDSLRGGPGLDSLFGGKGNDLVRGDSGADLIFGDLGRDSLFGGAGRDTFAIGLTTGGAAVGDADVLADFQALASAEPDVIRLVEGLRPSDVEVIANSAGDAVLRSRESGQFLAVFPGVAPAALDPNNPTQFEWFTTAIAVEPAPGEGQVNASREITVRFNSEIDGASFSDPGAFYLEAGGSPIAGQVVVSSTARFVTFVPDEVLPPGTEVRIVADGSKIRDSRGLPVDLNGGGIPGVTRVASFRTESLVSLLNTVVEGFIFDSFNRNPDGSDRPLAGVTLTVEGLPNITTTTDANGFFRLENVPGPDFFVDIDGTTVSNAPEGFIYAGLVEPFESVPGRTVQMARNGDPFNVYLPPLQLSDVQTLSPTETTNVGFGAGGTDVLAAAFPGVDPNLWQFTQLTLAPGSAVDRQGNPVTQAAIVPVEPSRLPAPLPPNLNPQLVISIQVPGASRFDIPAPIQFPNLDGLAPGEQSIIFSFNHESGRFEAIGNGTVSADGQSVVSDPGVGILAPGWHLTLPGVMVDICLDAPIPDAYWQITYGDFVIRGQVGAETEISNVIAPNTAFTFQIYDHENQQIGTAVGQTGASGSEVKIRELSFEQVANASDGDNDGLVNPAEPIVGTDPNNPDTDGDGLNDGPELDQGSNPLDGRGFPTGMIAQTGVRGEARAIWTTGGQPSTAGTANRGSLAYLATGSYGLAIADISRPDRPIITGQLQLPGTAVDVSVDATQAIAAVASIGETPGTTGGSLHLVDVSNPDVPRLIQTIFTPARQVEVAGGVAYVAGGTTLTAIDLASGASLQTLELPGSGQVTGMARDGNLLFAYVTGSDTLAVIDISAPADAAVVGEIGVPIASFEVGIFAAGNIVYLSGSGIHTVNVNNPANPQLVSPADSPFSANNLALNGSGLGLLAALNRGLGIFDLSDPAVTDSLLVEFDGANDNAQDVAIAQGFGFVADRNLGLKVFSYLPPDTAGITPIAQISSPVRDVLPNQSGVQIIEGSYLPIEVSSTEDIQASAVDLLVNDRVVASDVSFPFDFYDFAPTIAANGSVLDVQARITDTGGNSSLSNLLVFELVEDRFGPLVTRTSPTEGQDILEDVPLIVSFNKPLDPTLIDLSGLNLTALGPDGLPNTGDDANVPLAGVELAGDRRLTITAAGPFGAGLNTLTISPNIIADQNGNPLAAPFDLTFDRTDQVGIRTADGFASELSSDPGIFQVFRGSNTGDITVSFAVVDPLTGNPATLGTDYQLVDRLGNVLSGNTVVIPNGLDVVPIFVRPISDEIIEGTELVQLRLTDGFAYSIDPANTEARVQIQDFIPPPPPPPPPPIVLTGPPVEITVQGNDILEGGIPSTATGGTVNVGTQSEFIFTRLGTDSSQALEVFFTTGNGTNSAAIPDATFGQDYQLRDRSGAINNTGRIIIPAGGTSASLFATAQEDNLAEGDEQIRLTIAPGFGYQVGTNNPSANVTIKDNDFVGITAVNSQAVEPFGGIGGGDHIDGSYSITRQGGTEAPLTVTFDILTNVGPTNVSADRATDYDLLDNGTPITGNTVTIPAGQSSKLITLRPLDEGDPMEPLTEVARIAIVPTVNYNVVPGQQQADVFIINE